MRLSNVENDHAFGAKMKLRMMSLLSGRRAPDVVRAILYRPEIFGKAFSDLMQPAMRGPSRWDVGERELFAAFTSKLNQCPF
ncbi:MAG: hypothetical protein ACYTGZ_13065 [Planctomycetota bacterium]|jgi:hypothetical protein